MLAPKITTHVADAMARMMHQYASLPETYTVTLPNSGITIRTSYIGVIIAVLADRMQGVENAIYQMQAGRLYYNGSTYPATGAQLDGIGGLVGVVRNGLTNAEYLLLIKATIAANYSCGTCENLIKILRLLFQASTLQMFEFFPAEVAFNLTSGILDVDLIPYATVLLKNAMSAGVNLAFISVPTTTSVFQFRDLNGPSVGGGFGDILNYPADPPLYSSIGGGFAALLWY